MSPWGRHCRVCPTAPAASTPRSSGCSRTSRLPAPNGTFQRDLTGVQIDRDQVGIGRLDERDRAEACAPGLCAAPGPSPSRETSGATRRRGSCCCTGRRPPDRSPHSRKPGSCRSSSDVRTNRSPVCRGRTPRRPSLRRRWRPGRWRVPRRLGGVKSGPIRNRCISFTASAWISGVRSFASSSVTPCRAKAGGLVGNGCVGYSTSPGTSVAVSTARSSMGHTGSPVTRSNT